ncbi:MAG: hypothetical protein ACREH9_04810 [Pseudomonadota bacterium]
MPYFVPIRPTSRQPQRHMRGLGDIIWPSFGSSVPAPPEATPPQPPEIDQYGFPVSQTPPPAPTIPLFVNPALQNPDGTLIASVPSAGGAVTAPASAPQGMPVGTILTYSAQIKVTFGSLLVPTRAADNVVADIGQALSQNWGIAVVDAKMPSFSVSAPGTSYAIALVVQLNRAYGKPHDVQAIIDGIVNGLIGVELLSSSISNPGGSAAPGPSWLSQYWPWLAAGGAALILGAKLL